MPADETNPALSALRSEEHTSELQSRFDLVCRLLLEKKNFPKADKLVYHHLHIAIQFPIVVHTAIADLPLPSPFGGFLLLLLDDDLRLGNISHPHIPF